MEGRGSRAQEPLNKTEVPRARPGQSPRFILFHFNHGPNSSALPESTLAMRLYRWSLISLPLQIGLGV